MTRISYRRATPENWELTIRRMMSLNNVKITPEVARRVIKSLSDSHGLAPEETRPIMFEAERRLIDFTYEGDKDTHELCSRCHSIGRVLSERRTKEEWNGLIAMHRYYYPGIDGASGGFRRGGPGGAGGGNAPTGRGRGSAEDNQQPMDKALKHLVDAFPLTSSDWTTWSAAMRTPRLAGRWALAGYEIGKGPVYGQFTIAERADLPDSFTTEGRFTYTKSGQTVARRSRAVVYTGFQWRGRSADAADDPGTWREVAFIERTLQEIKGRWFTGAYDETGIDVTLRRVTNDPLVSGTDVSSLRSGTTAQRVRVYGVNLPASLAAADIDFGQGVKVSRVVSAMPEMVAVDVEVAADARMGPRDISIAGSTKPSALVVYKTMDGIKVVPQAGLARLGGVTFPIRAEQFEARGVSNGPDGKPNTPDDLDLGPVEARWSIEEYTATFKDDDVRYVGEIAQNGLFTPNVEGPNPNRPGNRNNVGDVWVVAAYSPPGANATARQLRARAHLLVTVPLYLDWGSKEVGR
jgi:quinohemoprotein amine dehydrogenase